MPRLTADDLARYRADYHQCGVTVTPLLDEVDALTAERDEAARMSPGCRASSAASPPASRLSLTC